MIMRLLVLYLIALFASCSESGKSNQKDENNSLSITDTASYIKITPQTKIEVLTAEKIIDTLIENYQAERDSLINWKLSKTQIEEIILKSKQLSILDCFEEPPAVSYWCKILVDSKLVYCQVLKDGKTNIKYSDTNVTLWYMDNDFVSYFHSKFWEVIPKETISSKRKSIVLKTQPTASYSKITSKTKIEVLTAEKIIDTLSPHYKEDYNDLNNWKLNKKQIKNIIYKSKEIAWEEWHYTYNNLPARYSGKLLINNKFAYYSVEAGAMNSITFSDTSIILGYPHTDYKKYFLIGEWKEPYEGTEAE